MDAMNRRLLYFGAGTALLGLFGLLAKGSPGSAPAGIVLLVLFGPWLLAPYAGLYLLQSMAEPTRANQIVVGVAAALLAALAVLGYVPSLLLSSRPRPCASATAVVAIPLYQGLPTLAASVTCALLPGRARR